MKKFAFTLAETLIVIGIIGVVAALTLPNLNHATGDKEKVTKVKKIYSSLTDAVDRAQVIYGDFDTWFKDIDCESDSATCNQRFAKRVTEFMKVSKDCSFDEGCFSNAPLLYPCGEINEDDYLASLQNFNAYMVTTSDGMSLRFMYNRTSNPGHIGVDIDGPNKGKNQIGNDIFSFSIDTDNNLYPDKHSDEYLYGGLEWGAYSTIWVIQNDNLDYLKCWEDLDWETQTSCK